MTATQAPLVKERSETLQRWDTFFTAKSNHHPFLRRSWFFRWKDVDICDAEKDMVPGRVRELFRELRDECIAKKIHLEALACQTDEELQHSFEILDEALVEAATLKCMEVVSRYFKMTLKIQGLPDNVETLTYFLQLNREKIATITCLDLRDKGIEYLPPDFTCLPFPALKEVNLDSNRLFAFPHYTKFFPGSKLTHFSARSNEVRLLSPDLGTNWALVELNLSHNKLTFLPALPSTWPVEKVNFFSNRISEMDPIFGMGWKKCTDVNLEGNCLYNEKKAAISRTLRDNLPTCQSIKV